MFILKYSLIPVHLAWNLPWSKLIHIVVVQRLLTTVRNRARRMKISPPLPITYDDLLDRDVSRTDNRNGTHFTDNPTAHGMRDASVCITSLSLFAVFFVLFSIFNTFNIGILWCAINNTLPMQTCCIVEEKYHWFLQETFSYKGQRDFYKNNEKYNTRVSRTSRHRSAR